MDPNLSNCFPISTGSSPCPGLVTGAGKISSFSSTGPAVGSSVPPKSSAFSLSAAALPGGGPGNPPRLGIGLPPFGAGSLAPGGGSDQSQLPVARHSPWLSLVPTQFGIENQQHTREEIEHKS